MSTVTFKISGHDVLVDEEDAHLLSTGFWRIIDKPRNRYVKLNHQADGKQTTVYLHRLIAGALPDQLVDHFNGNTLDNRRQNLRISSVTSNARNRAKQTASSSRFKGVSFQSATGKWRMQIRIDGRRITKAFGLEVEAAYAYDMASLEHHGEHGRRNFLPLCI